MPRQRGEVAQELLLPTLEGFHHVVERLLDAPVHVVREVSYLLPPPVHLAQGEHDPFAQFPRRVGALPECLDALLRGGDDLLVRVSLVEVQDALGAHQLVAREAEHLSRDLVFDAQRASLGCGLLLLLLLMLLHTGPL